MDKSKCKVKNIDEFLKLITDGYHPIDKWLYRGVTRASHSLHPVIGRRDALKFRKGVVNKQDFREKERRLLFEFKRQAFAYARRSPVGDLDWLCLARHYGLATRLLDWTTNPLVALFFAANKEIDDDEGFAVYQYKPRNDQWKLYYEPLTSIKRTTTSNPIETEHKIRKIPVAQMSMANIQEAKKSSFVFNPTFIDERFIRQSSVFLFCHEPWEDFADEPDQEIVKFEFPDDARKGVRHRLAILGVTPSFIRPGLDGLCEELNDINVYYKKKFLRPSLAEAVLEKQERALRNS